MQTREEERLINQATPLNWYIRMIRTKRFWLATTIYVVALSVLVAWLHSLGVFYKWMEPTLFIGPFLTFVISIATLLRLSKPSNNRD